MENFKDINERYEINFSGVIRDKVKNKYYRTKGNYIRISPKCYFNKSKTIYKVWQKELEHHYISRGYKFVCDYEPKFSRVFMVNSKGEIINIKRGVRVLAKKHDKEMLWEDGKEGSVHIIVYKAFIGEITGFVLHKDGNRLNNNADNLYIEEHD